MATTSTQASVLFSGELQSIRAVLNLLKAIQIKNIATCNIYDEGITLTVEEAQCVKAVAYIKRYMFENYRKQPDRVIGEFGIGLNTLIDCLSLLGPPSTAAADTCRIRYAREGAHLEIIREDKENDVSTHCRLVTLEPDIESMDLSVNDDPYIIQKTIMRSSWLKDALSDLDKSCERITMTFSPQDPCFRLTGEGNSGTFQMEYPEHSESFVSFQCEREVTYSYHYSHIMLCNKALDQSDEVSLRVSRAGVLCMLFRIQTANQDTYVEFTILPYEAGTN